ncbi:MAG: MIP/aquaporin family protein [Lactobacillus sp.]|nr:MIP/aquaporin family protein [Lactobacillus sp.]
MAEIIKMSLGEFIGTFILILLGCGVNCAISLKQSKANGAGWVATSLGWGFAVTFGIYASAFLGPAHLNPAVTIGMVVAGIISPRVIIPFIIAQVAGAILGAFVVWINYRDQLNATREPDTMLGCFATSPAIYHPIFNVFSEFLGTFVLQFLLLAFTRGHFTHGLNPIVVGLLIMAIGLSLGATTGYAINPARDFGPRLIYYLLPIEGKGSAEWSYSYVPIVGPIMGAVVASLIFKLL